MWVTGLIDLLSLLSELDTHSFRVMVYDEAPFDCLCKDNRIRIVAKHPAIMNTPASMIETIAPFEPFSMHI